MGIFPTTNFSDRLDVQIKHKSDQCSANLEEVFCKEGVSIHNFKVRYPEKRRSHPITVSWKIPAINVKGIWKPSTDFNKRIQADWELDNMESRISIDAPVVCLFGHNDENTLTFACSDAINKLDMNARLREEDNCFHCHMTFFTEQQGELTDFEAQLYFDFGNVHFSESLKEVSKWWETFEELRPTQVPEIANKPLYSTWYQFHQNLEVDLLLSECRQAYDLGYRSIIIDDGWQTRDSNRGYDFTGDWRPDRIPEMADFVRRIHETGMKAALWYSVPFCGKHSKAYQRFKGKFLTEEHRWAPVLDPRYPEVRDYLIGLYTHALREWNLDGFKLDFIDEFKRYPNTSLGREDGRDYASINEAVDRLLTDATNALQRINPEVFIEFRQKYTGPAMRKYGNMFRAFDCPGDATMNRLRIADIKMLCGNTAVHADMVTWHPDESLEVAALQLINTLFGVPQLSVMLRDTPEPYLKMIAFYTRYWNANADILVNGNFRPSNPLANYPVQRVSKNGTTIVGVYGNYLIDLETTDHIHILNAQLADRVTFCAREPLGTYRAQVHDCRGKLVQNYVLTLKKGVSEIPVPPCGILMLEKTF